MLAQPRKARAQEIDERDGAKAKSQPRQDCHALERANGKAMSQRAEYASVQAIAGAELAQHIVIDGFFLYREAAEEPPIDYDMLSGLGTRNRLDRSVFGALRRDRKSKRLNSSH